MKKFIPLILILSLIPLSISCVNEDIITSEENSENKEKSGQLYLSLSIADADQSGTRVAGDPTYENGFAWESKILNGMVYVFYGKKENDAVCITKGEINFVDSQDPTIHNDNCYLSRDAIIFRNIQIDYFDGYDENYDDETSVSKYYALVVLNANNDFVGPEINEKFKDWAKKPQSSKMIMTDGENKYKITANGTKDYQKYCMTMVNATGQENHQTEEDYYIPTTLVKIKASDFSLTPHDNTQTPGTIIYMIRNVARVIVTPDSKLDYDNKETTIGELKAELNIMNIGLDVTNKTSYPVMNIDGISWEKDYFHSGDTPFDRVYWVKDPNYHNESKFTAQSFYRNSGRAIIVDSEKEGDMMGDVREPRYCLENTFDVDCMLQGQTTRLLVKGQWAIYDVEKGTENNFLGNIDNIDCDFHRDFENNDHNCKTNLNPKDFYDFYKIEGQDYAWCRKHIKEEVKKVLAEMLNVEEPEFNIIWEDNKNGGYYPLKELLSIKIPKSNNKGEEEDNNEEVSDDIYNQVAKAMGLVDATKDIIGFYNQSVCWLVLRIPHFNELTPWNDKTDVETKKINGKDYFVAKYKDKHLGRYGVVRNNFYNITVKEIHSLGTPCIPEIIDELTDDVPGEMYMDVDIKVNAWAKHDITVSW